ncbi:hypothetical protein [Streptomyces sp. NPDC040750]|uniref:hypothetical protein n=1 Tax=Streptomyces sp. NPDC040750 TaxID=3154491 RepID=UPI00340DEB7E
MQIAASTVSLTVDDVVASKRFFTTHLGYVEQAAAGEGFASLSRDDAAVDVVLPLREEPWGERLFQVADPNGVIVQFVEWAAPADPRLRRRFSW